jgi:hypothetical protein
VWFFLDECSPCTSVISSQQTGLYVLPIELMHANARQILKRKRGKLVET